MGGSATSDPAWFDVDGNLKAAGLKSGKAHDYLKEVCTTQMGEMWPLKIINWYEEAIVQDNTVKDEILQFFEALTTAYCGKTLTEDEANFLYGSIQSIFMSTNSYLNHKENLETQKTALKICQMKVKDKKVLTKNMYNPILNLLVANAQEEQTKWARLRMPIPDTSTRKSKATDEVMTVLGFLQEDGKTPKTFAEFYKLYQDHVRKLEPKNDEAIKEKLAFLEAKNKEWAELEEARRKRISQEKKKKAADKKKAEEEKKKQQQKTKGASRDVTRNTTSDRGSRTRRGADDDTETPTRNPTRPTRRNAAGSTPETNTVPVKPTKPSQVVTAATLSEIVKALAAETKNSKSSEKLSEKIKQATAKPTPFQTKDITQEQAKMSSSNAYTKALFYILSFVPSIYNYLQTEIRTAIENNNALITGFNTLLAIK